MSVNIQTIRELAERRRQEDSLIAQLPQLEAEARQQEQVKKAKDAAETLEARLDNALSSFQAAKAESDTELAGWLAEGDRLIQRRQTLAQQAGNVISIARQLAQAKLDAEIVNDPDWHTSNSVSFKREILQGHAIDELKRRTGQGYLMSVQQPFNDIASDLLNFFVSFTGDAILKRRPPEQAQVFIETTRGSLRI